MLREKEKKGAIQERLKMLESQVQTKGATIKRLTAEVQKLREVAEGSTPTQPVQQETAGKNKPGDLRSWR